MQRRPDRLRLRRGVLLEDVCGRPVVLDVDRDLLFELEEHAASIVRELLPPGATVSAPGAKRSAQSRTPPSRSDVIASLEDAGFLVDAGPPASAS